MFVENVFLFVLLLKNGFDFRVCNKDGLSCYWLVVSIKVDNLVKVFEYDFGIKEFLFEG